MRIHPKQVLALLFAVVSWAGCGSSSETEPVKDSAVKQDTPTVKLDSPIVSPDLKPSNDTTVTADAKPDSNLSGDAAVDTGTIDGVSDTNTTGKDVPSIDAGAVDSGVTNPHGDTPIFDSAITPADAPADADPDAFVPAPAVPIVVNSSNNGVYNLVNGTWKIFYFDAIAGQIYCISELSGIVHGYVSTSPSVSPTNFQYQTSESGTLAFTATAAQRYYVAVAVSGGGVSGSFQVADGGQLLALGKSTLTLTAPDLDNTYFFRFPIANGHDYSITLEGPTQLSVGLAVAPRAERSANGQFSYSIWGKSGGLPFTNEAVPAISVANSYSGFYYLLIRVMTNMTLTVTISQTT